MSTDLEKYLNKFDEAAWLAAVDALLPSIHEVDRTAIQVWFRFYPLGLFRYLEQAEDRDAALHDMQIQGRFELKDQIDTSHEFLYGHRFWKTVKAAIEAEAVTFANEDIELAEEIRRVAALAAEKVQQDTSLLIGITAAGFMTLVQSGLDNFKAASGDVKEPTGLMAKSPSAILAERAKDDSQGFLGFLKTINKEFSIIYDENTGGKFRIMNDQEITSASAQDRSQNWQERDPRCWNGVIPTECTAAACGTCWVGVIGGAEKLSDVAPRERRAMKVFGYNQPSEERPFMRLACQAKALGNATIVISPWNGVFGKEVYHNVDDKELDPVTTSAKKLRETIASATEK